MRDRIISNVLIKMGNRIKKKELQFLENVLVEELGNVQIKRESTDLIKYNDSFEKLKDMFLATLIVENKSNRTIKQYNLHLTQFADYFAGKEVKDIDATDIRSFCMRINKAEVYRIYLLTISDQRYLHFSRGWLMKNILIKTQQEK